eukprot:4004239-Ditylum_brightwellii.AAC.1
MSHKPKHVSACKWIAKIIKLDNYLPEFPIPTRIEPRRMNMEESLEILETEFLCCGNFRWTRKMPTTKVATCKDPPEKVEKCKAKHKLDYNCGEHDKVPY